jgi:hypothetical protein
MSEPNRDSMCQEGLRCIADRYDYPKNTKQATCKGMQKAKLSDDAAYVSSNPNPTPTVQPEASCSWSLR